MNAMAEAKKHVLETGNPVILQANCVRMESHSNSDRHELYRSENERNYVKEYDPLAKFRRMVLRYERLSDADLLSIEDEVTAIVKDAHKKAMSAPDPSPESIFDFVMPEPYMPAKYRDGVHNEKVKVLSLSRQSIKH
jgi:2-oxoisovalerate dehydrogenase E1 component